MSAAFLPLLPNAESPAGNAPMPFQSLRPRSDSEASAKPCAVVGDSSLSSSSSCSARRGQPAVHCERDGDRITRIRVTCACGEIIELDCAYDSPTLEARDQQTPAGE